ncbi:uncharacterized protein ATNIH1004_006054 [Aspergillus tanneri]|uniref:Glyoxalase-like domain-containing protein n=1 Tax=Aspergillus tanneri TaxID=1220188 RepID=A0A5M9MK22_9EURO|nr:uncharacterized protein ATNIH1004_006054 [Aspergillus tanneri]KAA8647361.1 hypothetical protein ATNIH1004_006054 [Aspergillus tanneri]
MTPVHFDHVLIQLSTPDFESPPSWLTENFTIIEGGTHTGNRTQNKLIILPDNTYIELLNIIRPQDDFHGYPGDFALTTISPFSANDNYRRLTGALAHPPGDGGLGVTYTPPQAGGRTTPRGEEIRWELVRPSYSNTDSILEGTAKRPTDTPFFCHDVTDRGLRVPMDPTGRKHSSGASGLEAIEVLVPREKVQAYMDLYTSVLGVAGRRRSGTGDEVEFPLRAPGSSESSGVVRLRVPRGTEDERYLRERGVGVSALVIKLKGEETPLKLPIAAHYLRGP